MSERPEPPDDLVNGIAPGYATEPINLPGFRCTCGFEGRAEDADRHLGLAHPANRDGTITCHMEEMATSGWCLRPLGHEGDQRPPSFNGGRWYANGWRRPRPAPSGEGEQR